jgi:hypothetical protein
LSCNGARASNVHWGERNEESAMNLIERVFGARPNRRPPMRAAAAPEIDRAPPGALWRSVRPRRSGPPVRAWLAQSDGAIASERGVLHYRRGDDYIVEYAPDDAAVVKRTVFERTYRLRPDGLHEKRTDVVYRYFTLPYAVIVRTLEGPQKAEPGDWIMEGVNGEIWPVRMAKARRKYQAA